MRARAGYDFLIQGMGGLMSVTGRPTANRAAARMKVGVALTDLLTGLYATIAILAALAHRDQAPARASTSTWRCSTCRWPAWPTRRRTT